MYKALLTAVLLLCTALSSTQAQAEVKAVKLCGREFLRAVVYTCGGSRWRREEDGPFSGESLLVWGPQMELRRRDMNSILTSLCCSMGCRKSDLSLLC
ncbi:insulin-like 5a [Periophthalmus magnuspinnatus]|uniref:insulin-like 5a n=1 Tax=Periophthalmus magnuspinnatus TaxID=409849 RepID=UPI00145ABEA4|nr:insulin-like 5a [Periophthalmus magnuspinnatus]